MLSEQRGISAGSKEFFLPGSYIHSALPGCKRYSPRMIEVQELLTSDRAMECTCGVNLQRWMTLYLESLNANGHHKYSIEDINNLPTVVGCTVSILPATMLLPLANLGSLRNWSGCFSAPLW